MRFVARFSQIFRTIGCYTGDSDFEYQPVLTDPCGGHIFRPRAKFCIFAHGVNVCALVVLCTHYLLRLKVPLVSCQIHQFCVDKLLTTHCFCNSKFLIPFPRLLFGITLPPTKYLLWVLTPGLASTGEE